MVSDNQLDQNSEFIKDMLLEEVISESRMTKGATLRIFCYRLNNQ